MAYDGDDDDDDHNDDESRMVMTTRILDMIMISTMTMSQVVAIEKQLGLGSTIGQRFCLRSHKEHAKP